MGRIYEKMTQLWFNTILFTPRNENRSYYTYYIQYILNIFKTEALVSNSFTPRNPQEVVACNQLKWSQCPIHWSYRDQISYRFLPNNLVNVLLFLCYHLYLEICVDINLNKLEFPSAKNTLCQVWRRRFSFHVHIVSKFIEIKIGGEYLKNIDVILILCFYIPLKKTFKNEL